MIARRHDDAFRSKARPRLSIEEHIDRFVSGAQQNGTRAFDNPTQLIAVRIAPADNADGISSQSC